jgi:hypothetical protein
MPQIRGSTLIRHLQYIALVCLGIIQHMSNALRPRPTTSSPFPELDHVMRRLIQVPKSEVDAARRKELKRKQASKRKRK